MASAALNVAIRFDARSDLDDSQTQDTRSSHGLHNMPAQNQGETTSIGSDTKHNSNSHSLSPTNFELDNMPLGSGACYNGPGLSKPPVAYNKDTSSRWSPAGNSTVEPNRPDTPRELEMSRPPTPTMTDPVNVVQTIFNPSINKWRFLSACLICFGQGMNDSAPGALLPSMERYYHVGYAIVSLIFIGNAVGFILAAFFVHALDDRLGRSRTIMFCEFVITMGYITMAATPSFPVFAAAFVVTGWGMATMLALNNVFCANLAGSTVVLGGFHGSYGIGGIIAPVIATAMVSKGIVFSRFYILLVGLRIISLVFGGWTFWQFERDTRYPNDSLTGSELPVGQETNESRQDVVQGLSKVEQLKRALKSRTTLVGALFIFAYQGAEVAISGWVISFLINYRGSDPAKVGYVTAGFWGGITLGRFTLSYAAYRIGEKAFTYGLIAGAIGFQLLVWFVPNVIGDSVAIAFLGLLLGPIYPCGTTVFTRLLPRSTQDTAMAFISSAGSFGGAVAPFLTGILAQAAGTWVLHPICIVMFVVMEVCWFSLPKLKKRRE